MPKKRKRVSYNEPGHAHKLTFSTYCRTRYFLDGDDCELFLKHLGAAQCGSVSNCGRTSS